MDALEPQNGIIGFFDVLGYQSIIDNNKIEDVAAVISKNLLTIPQVVTDALGTFLTRGESVPDISWLIISDTIILAAPFGKGAETHSRLRTWLRLLVHCARLMRNTFDAGLPLRGVIDVGDFYIEGHSFAGKPIIRAFREVHEMETAGCMLTDAAGAALDNEVTAWAEKKEEKAVTIRSFLSQLVFPYVMPLKIENRIRNQVINWMKPMKEFDAPPNDLRQYVLEAFHAFGKDVPTSVVAKLENTERLIRYCNGKLWLKKA
jgi:hypothetical protein